MSPSPDEDQIVGERSHPADFANYKHFLLGQIKILSENDQRQLAMGQETIGILRGTGNDIGLLGRMAILQKSVDELTRDVLLLRKRMARVEEHDQVPRRLIWSGVVAIIVALITAIAAFVKGA